MGRSLSKYYLKIQFLPQRKHNVSPLQRSMVFQQIVAICAENRTKPLSTLCGQNAELLIVKARVTYSYHWVLKCYRSSITWRINLKEGSSVLCVFLFWRLCHFRRVLCSCLLPYSCLPVQGSNIFSSITVSSYPSALSFFFAVSARCLNNICMYYGGAAWQSKGSLRKRRTLPAHPKLRLASLVIFKHIKKAMLHVVNETRLSVRKVC
jgi:hypothetical protein